MLSTKHCAWPGTDPLMLAYHDTEWGVPCRDDQKLFEFIVLDTFQAGLSWQIVLNKRENFRRAFNNFDAKKIAKYDARKVNSLLKDAEIIRNRLKILGTIKNAKAFLQTQKDFGTFAKYLWDFVGHKTIDNKLKHQSKIAATSRESDVMSKDMKQRGFAFCGSTVCYAFMQGAGLVNDHLIGCFRHATCNRLT